MNEESSESASAPSKRLPSILKLMNPFDRQREFLEKTRQHEFTLYGGAAGGGKSRMMRWSLVDYLVNYAFKTRHVRNAEVGLFCETYGTLEDRQVRKMRQEFPDWLGRLVGSTAGPNFILHEQYGGGIICMRNLDNPDKYWSSEFAAIAVDEITKNPPQTFDDLRSRKRWPGLPHNPFMAGTNPGGPMHALCKRIWIDRDIPENLLEEYTQGDFAYVPCLPTDNPYIEESYLRQLRSLPEPMRSALLEGDWNAFAGMFFRSLYRAELEIDPFDIPRHWPLFGSLDPGWGGAPCSFGPWTVRPGTKTERAKVIRIATYYEHPGNNQTHARGISEFLSGLDYIKGRVPDRIYAGHDAFAKRDKWANVGSDVTLSDVLADYGLYCVKANTQRVPGWANLQTGIQERDILWFRGLNEPWWSEAEAVQGDDRVVEDIEGRGNDPNVQDHCLDDHRYGSIALYKPMAPTPEPPPDKKDFRVSRPRSEKKQRGRTAGLSSRKAVMGR